MQKVRLVSKRSGRPCTLTDEGRLMLGHILREQQQGGITDAQAEALTRHFVALVISDCVQPGFFGSVTKRLNKTAYRAEKHAAKLATFVLASKRR